MKIALLQIDPTIGDLDGNAVLLAEAARTATSAGADLALASELSLLGYPPRDLLLLRSFVERGWEVARRLAVEVADGAPLLVGLAELNEVRVGRPLYNAAVLLSGGEVAQVFRKTLLPTYDVFDEDRYFEPACDPQLLELKGRRIGVSICEDVWNDADFWQRRRYHVDPLEGLAQAGVDLILNLSASPFTIGKQEHREAMLGAIARKYGRPLLYVNQVGGNDELVFDGRSLAMAADGRIVGRAAAFAPDVLLVDVDELAGDLPTAGGAGAEPGASAAPLKAGAGIARSLAAGAPLAPDDFTRESEVWRALVLGTRDYVAKSGFSRVLLGLSGGIDSALVCAVATEALGPQNVLAVMLPSPYSSEGSISDSVRLAENLGVETVTLPIAECMRAFDQTLAPVFAGRQQDVTEENIQARIRGNLLMAVSNKFHSLLLTTGNKSELAVGYCTIYGDMSGGFAVISDVPKTLVYAVSRWRNHTAGREIIPENILEKAPSAELRPDQTDQDSLPPYDLLDQILELAIEEHYGPEEIAARGFDPATVARVLGLIRANEFKRKQMAPGIKVTDRAFGMGWRMPIATVPRARRQSCGSRR